LTYACELLTNGHVSVTQTAAECGFDNVNYFSRLFKKRYNVPPSRINTIKFIDPYREEP